MIKGSEETLTKEKRYLSLQDYEHLSSQHSTLEGRTPDVYGLFESYLKLKMENNGYDSADRCVVMGYRIPCHSSLLARTKYCDTSKSWVSREHELIICSYTPY